MNSSELKVIADLTVELTRLRQNECKHLCIENFAPRLFGRLVEFYLYGTEDRVRIECTQP